MPNPAWTLIENRVRAIIQYALAAADTSSGSAYDEHGPEDSGSVIGTMATSTVDVNATVDIEDRSIGGMDGTITLTDVSGVATATSVMSATGAVHFADPAGVGELTIYGFTSLAAQWELDGDLNTMASVSVEIEIQWNSGVTGDPIQQISDGRGYGISIRFFTATSSYGTIIIKRDSSNAHLIFIYTDPLGSQTTTDSGQSLNSPSGSATFTATENMPVGVVAEIKALHEGNGDGNDPDLKYQALGMAMYGQMVHGLAMTESAQFQIQITAV